MTLGQSSSECLFCRISQGELPSAKIYEDDYVFAFLDIAPCCKGHTLLVPKVHSRNALDFEPSYAEHIVRAIQIIAPALMEVLNAEGFHVIQNNEPAALQSVFHSHWHIIPRAHADNVNLLDRIPYESQEMMQEIALQVANAIKAHNIKK